VNLANFNQDCGSNVISGCTFLRVLAEKNNFSSTHGPAIRVYKVDSAEHDTFDNVISGCAVQVASNGIEVYGGARTVVDSTTFVGLDGDILYVDPAAESNYGIKVDTPAYMAYHTSGEFILEKTIGAMLERTIYSPEKLTVDQEVRTATVTLSSGTSVAAALTVEAYERAIGGWVKVNEAVGAGVKFTLDSITLMQLSTATTGATNYRFIDQTTISPCSASARTVTLTPVSGSFTGGEVVVGIVVSNLGFITS
jgi:hypothetical protein